MTESEPEEQLLTLIRRGGLPAPEANARLGRYRPDLLWREQRLVVEFDSWTHHSSRQSFESDRRRDSEMTSAGYTVVRVTWRQLHEQPERILVWIATELARAARR